MKSYMQNLWISSILTDDDRYLNRFKDKDIFPLSSQVHKEFGLARSGQWISGRILLPYAGG